MVIIGGADKFVIRSIQGIANLLNHFCDAVHILLRRNARLFSFQFYLLAVLIRPCLKEHIIAVFPLKSGDAVRQYDLVAVPNMRFARCVSYCRRNIIFPFIHFVHSSRSQTMDAKR